MSTDYVSLIASGRLIDKKGVYRMLKLNILDLTRRRPKLKLYKDAINFTEKIDEIDMDPLCMRPVSMFANIFPTYWLTRHLPSRRVAEPQLLKSEEGLTLYE